MAEPLNRYRAAQARRNRRSRFIGEPDYSVNITQKKCSKREVYNVFPNRTLAALETASQNRPDNWYWTTFGTRWKMRYRVNVYLKGNLNG
jgi:hypothetical protein